VKITGRLQRKGSMVTACLGIAASLMLCGGCATPPGRTSLTTVLSPDEDDGIGGTFLESQDMRAIASKMTGKILSTPAVAQREGTVRIALASIKNNSRFVVDKDMFMKRLRVELNEVAGDRVRFLAQDIGQDVRAQMLAEQDESLWTQVASGAAKQILASLPARPEGEEPARIAVIPVRNTNLSGVNADSLTEFVRAAILEQGKGRVVFLAREKNGKVLSEILNEQDVKSLGLVKTRKAKEMYGVDYFLGGQLVAQSLLPQSAINVTDARVGEVPGDPRLAVATVQTRQVSPPVAKYLNVTLVDAEAGTVVAEKMIQIERVARSNVGSAQYILSGELSALSKASDAGNRSDYILLTFQLVDPATNEVIWEGKYESKKKSAVSVLYK